MNKNLKKFGINLLIIGLAVSVASMIMKVINPVGIVSLILSWFGWYYILGLSMHPMMLQLKGTSLSFKRWTYKFALPLAITAAFLKNVLERYI